MYYKLDNHSLIFMFSSENASSLKINPGDVVEIETKDCFSDQVKKEEDIISSMEWDKVNPATGPIYIEGAQKGDVLKITLQKIVLKEKGVLATGDDMGVLGDKLDRLYSKVVDIKDDKVIFSSKLEIPIKPMIGVIGVAPACKEINCGTPGSHGGNMDNTMIGEGAVLYLPIFKEGAYFALGDVHAVMGDGEIGVSGVEVGAFVTVKLDVIKGLKLNNPLLENDSVFATIASAESLDKAVDAAVHDMFELISPRVDLPTKDISMLFSIVGDAQICQVVDPLKTARFVVPKWVLNKYDFILF
jgi:amidase